MGAPPLSKAGAGRANSQGIRCLYLADSPETTTFEVRAGLYDDICIGTFKARKPIRVVNLALLDKISPFRDIDIVSLAINEYISCLDSKVYIKRIVLYEDNGVYSRGRKKKCRYFICEYLEKRTKNFSQCLCANDIKYLVVGNI